jgi:hypothetical protein
MQDHSNKNTPSPKQRPATQIRSKQLKMMTLAPPPRHVPGTIKLAVRFGHPVAGCLAWAISALIILPLLFELKRALGGFNYEPGLPWKLQLLKLGFPVFCVLLVLVLAFIAYKASERDIRLLENGRLGYARLVKKAKFKIPDDFLFRMSFEYEVDGKKYKTWVDNPMCRKRLEDDLLEPILFDSSHPNHSLLVDSMPAYVGVDSAGGMKDRLPFIGFLYLLMPVSLLAAIVYFVIF